MVWPNCCDRSDGDREFLKQGDTNRNLSPPLSLSCPASYSLLPDDLNDSLWFWPDNVVNRIPSKETLQSGRGRDPKWLSSAWRGLQFIGWVSNLLLWITLSPLHTPVFSPILSTNSQNNGAQLLTDNRHTPDHNKPLSSSTQTPDQHWTSPCKSWRSPSSGPRWFLPWGPCPSPTKNCDL